MRLLILALFFFSTFAFSKPHQVISRIEGEKIEFWVKDSGVIKKVVEIGAEGVESGGSTPTGSIMAFAGGNVPIGWLLCDGSAKSRTTYATLHAVLKDVGGTDNYGWGNGDGSTTFNIPNLQGQFLRGAGANGSALATLQADSTAKNGLSNSAAVVSIDVPPWAGTTTSSLSTSSHTHNEGSYFAQVYLNSGGGFFVKNVTPVTSWTHSLGANIGTAGTSSSHTIGAGIDGTSAEQNPGAVTGVNTAHNHEPFNVTVPAQTITCTPAGTCTETRPASYGVYYIIRY